jgi:parvulin-like peptidyl-prolyl isomerase
MRILLMFVVCAGLWAQAPPSAPKKAPAKAAPKPAAARKPAPVPVVPAVKPAADPSDPVVFSVGVEAFTRSQFELLLASLPAQLQSEGATPQGKRRLAERLAEVKSLAQEARSRRLIEKPSVAYQIRLQEDSILANSLVQDLMATAKVDEAEVQSHYDARKPEFEEVVARHILIRFQGSRVPLRQGQQELSEPEALAKCQSLRERLLKGEDFAAVAKAESDDAGTGARGGDLGAFGRGRMVPVFEQAAFSAETGKISEPLRTEFGYHLIQVVERRYKPLSDVRAEIVKKRQSEAANTAVSAIRNAVAVKLDEGYFGAAAPPEADPAGKK